MCINISKTEIQYLGHGNKNLQIYIYGQQLLQPENFFFYRATLQRISRPSKMGRGWPLVICPSSPHILHCQVRSFYVKQYQRNYGDSSENFDPLRPAFEGHSRSSVPTRIDRRPMTSYSYSAATTGLSRVVSETNGDFSRKLLIFPPRVFKSPLRQLYLELDNTGWP